MTVQKDDGIEGLVLRGGSQVFLVSPVAQKGAHLGRAEGAGVPEAMEAYKTDGPAKVGQLGS